MITTDRMVATLRTRLACLRPQCLAEYENRWLDVLSTDVAPLLWRRTSRRRKTEDGQILPRANRALLTPPVGHPRCGRFAITFLYPDNAETGRRLEAVADVLSGIFFVMRAAKALPEPISNKERGRMLADLLAQKNVDPGVAQWILVREAQSASQPRTRRRTDTRAKFIVCAISRLCERHFGAPMDEVSSRIAMSLGCTAGARGALTREVSRSARRARKVVANDSPAVPER
jgi:hypothetical protein